MNKVALISSPVFQEHDTGNHPECAGRLVAIEAGLKQSGLWEKIVHLSPESATESDLQLVHDAVMVEKVREICQQGGGYLDPDTYASSGSWEAGRAAAGAVITAIKSVLNNECEAAFCAVRPPGHHATPHHSMGFCLFNNAAVGAAYALANELAKKILIIDFDVHHGNGTQDAFYQSNSVYYYSLHQYPHYPMTGISEDRGDGTGLNHTLNIPLAAGTNGSQYLEYFQQGLDLIGQEYEPELIIISAGFDAHQDDPLADIGLSTEDYAELTRRIISFGREKKIRGIVSTLEGGYQLDALAASVNAHIKALM